MEVANQWMTFDTIRDTGFRSVKSYHTLSHALKNYSQSEA